MYSGYTQLAQSPAPLQSPGPQSWTQYAGYPAPSSPPNYLGYFKFHYAGDRAGIIHLIATNGGTRPWQCPVQSGRVKVTASSLPRGSRGTSLPRSSPTRCPSPGGLRPSGCRLSWWATVWRLRRTPWPTGLPRQGRRANLFRRTSCGTGPFGARATRSSGRLYRCMRRIKHSASIDRLQDLLLPIATPNPTARS